MKLFSVLIVILTFSTSCHKEINSFIRNNEGVIISKPYVWKVVLDDGKGDGFSLEPSYLNNNQVLLAGTLLNVPYLYSVNTETGKINWKKSIDFENIALESYYSYNNQIVCTGNKGYIYNISTLDGSLNWKSDIQGRFWVRVTGIDSFFFVCGSTSSSENPFKISSAWLGKVGSGKMQVLCSPEMVNVDTANIPLAGIGGVERTVPTYGNNGDLLLFLFINRYTNDNSHDSSYYGLYNSTKSIWVYKNKKLVNGRAEVVMDIPIIVNDRIYIKTTSDMYCLDLNTGEIIWKTFYNDYFSFYGQCIADNKIFAIIDGAGKLLVCHDLNTGSKLWSTPVVGFVSAISYLNGVIYFTSMGDGRLYAVDALNGKILWYIKSPDGQSFKLECSVVEGKNNMKGKIIASSFLNGYCYEAER